MLFQAAVVRSKLTPIDIGAYRHHVVGVGIAARCGELREHPGVTRYHDDTRRGGRERQRLAAFGMIMNELLCQRPAPGDAEDIDRTDVELVQQPIGEPRQPT
jgi:hypothetical protein